MADDILKDLEYKDYLPIAGYRWVSARTPQEAMRIAEAEIKEKGLTIPGYNEVEQIEKDRKEELDKEAKVQQAMAKAKAKAEKEIQTDAEKRERERAEAEVGQKTSREIAQKLHSGGSSAEYKTTQLRTVLEDIGGNPDGKDSKADLIRKIIDLTD